MLPLTYYPPIVIMRQITFVTRNSTYTMDEGIDGTWVLTSTNLTYPGPYIVKGEIPTVGERATFTFQKDYNLRPILTTSPVSTVTVDTYR